MSDEQKNGDEPENVGVGGNLIGATKEDRIEQRAIKQRWRVSEQELREVLIRQIRIAVDPKTKDRTATSAARAVIAAVGQNQADEHKQQPDELNINLGTGIQIIEDRNWYGNFDRLSTLAAAASDQDSDGSGQVQGGGGRPPVGKNGDGTPGGD